MDSYNNSNYPGQGHNPQGYTYRPPAKPPGSALAGAALVLGMISFITAIMMTIYFPFIFGSLAIVFALLSKGRAAKLIKYAKTGIICGIAGITANIIIIISTFIFILSNPSTLMQAAQQYDQIYEQVYGIPSEEIFGDSLQDIVEDFIESMGK